MNLILKREMRTVPRSMQPDLYVLASTRIPKAPAHRLQTPASFNCRSGWTATRRHAPNWELVMPPPCSKGCAPILEELVLEYGMLYDLRVNGGGAY